MFPNETITPSLQLDVENIMLLLMIDKPNWLNPKRVIIIASDHLLRVLPAFPSIFLGASSSS